MGQYNYDRTKVEALLTALWNEGTMVNELAPDQDMPNAAKNVAHGGDLLAEMADISRAVEKAGLTEREECILFLRYGHGWTHREIAPSFSVSQQRINAVLEHSVGKVVWAINGGWKPIRTHVHH